MHLDDATREKLEAAAFRALMHHLLEKRPDVQNIDLMNLAGFCRNCLSRWSVCSISCGELISPAVG